MLNHIGRSKSYQGRPRGKKSDPCSVLCSWRNSYTLREPKGRRGFAGFSICAIQLNLVTT